MLKIKNKEEIIYSALMVCLIEGCKEEATKLWSTESNIIDVCSSHYNQLEAERYLT